MRLWVVAGVMALVAGGAQARDILECRLAGNSTWVPTIVVVERNPGADEVTVFDPIIRHFHGAPIRARVDTDNAVRTTVVWTIRDRGQTSTPADVQFRLTHRKAGDSARITVQALGYVGPYEGTGTCLRITR
ncbi:MAG TPA: hypothetical protein VLA78_08340 [Paracoccaceae bacterium]|nr:hypothetical protein [Paracoccaceae bacterium]